MNETNDSGIGISTTIISCNMECPSVEPISGPHTHNRRTFTADELQLVGEALDAGLFYTDDIFDFCKDRWLSLRPFDDVCLTRCSQRSYHPAHAETVDRRHQLKALDEVLKVSPRGTWFLLRWDWQNERKGTTWFLHMSCGDGTIDEVQTGPIWNNESREPNFADGLRSVLGMDIYRVTNAERDRRESARSRALLKQHGWVVGATLRNVTIGSKTFSKATITSVTDDGRLFLTLSKRGSKFRYQWTGLAQAIEVEGLERGAPAYGQMVATAA